MVVVVVCVRCRYAWMVVVVVCVRYRYAWVVVVVCVRVYVCMGGGGGMCEGIGMHGWWYV